MDMTADVTPVEGYEPQIGLLLASLEDGTREWLGELGDVDEETLVWRPFENGPSVGAQILHIAEVEAWWIQKVVGGRAVPPEFWERVRAEETHVDAGRWGEAPRMPFDAYRAILAEVREATYDVLKGVDDPARALRPDSNRPGITVRWIVSHVVQHEAYHGGQAVVVKRLHRGSIW